MVEPKDILIDFDGTVVKHRFPNIGEDIGAAPVLRDLLSAGHRLILFTMRSNKLSAFDSPGDIPAAPYLDQAIYWFESNGIWLYGINTCPGQDKWTSSPKAYGQLIIDDTCLGIPLSLDPGPGERPYVNWAGVRHLLQEKNYLPIY